MKMTDTVQSRTMERVRGGIMTFSHQHSQTQGPAPHAADSWIPYNPSINCSGEAFSIKKDSNPEENYYSISQTTSHHARQGESSIDT